MPTFDDPRKDAAETSAALRGLAHATRTFSDPADTQPVIGDLLASIRSLRQVLDQLADAHIAARAQAHDDAGNQLAGASSALAAADELHQAGTVIDSVEWRLDAAAQHSARIAWQSENRRRWISVVFLQGEEADRVLDIVDASGTGAAITHLTGYDHGQETTQAALENGYVYDAPPAGALDHTAAGDGYALVYSPFAGTVNLFREYETPPDPAPLTPHRRTVPAREAPRQREAHVGKREPADWFSNPARPAASSGRELSL